MRKLGKNWGCRGVTIAALAFSFSIFSAATPAIEAQARVVPSIKPPAPGPTYLTRLDKARLLSVHDALDRKQFSVAKAEIRSIEAPVARSLGQWFYFNTKDPGISIGEAGAFLTAHPEWPATRRIQSFAESKLTNNDSADAILSFFADRAPVTGDGKVHYARALLAKGRTEAATAAIRDAWVNHNFSVSEERKIIAAHASRLRKEDHAARVDRLLWSRQVTNARRTFPYLSTKARRMAEARAALLLRAGSGPRLYRNLTKEEQLDSGVLYSAVRYYRRTDEEQYAISLAAMAPDRADTLRNTDRWWTERRLLLQSALKRGHFSDAYALAAQNGMDSGGDFADAEFVAGWIALRFLKEPERAITHFEAMTGGVATPISLSRGYYWLGRAASAAGKAEDANAYFKTAATYPYSFYGQLAAETLGGDAVVQRFDPTPGVSAIDKALFNSRPAVAPLRMLTDLNLDYELMVFAYHVDDQLEQPGEFLELANITNGEGAPHLTVRAGKVGAQADAFAADVSYPMVFVPDEARAFVRPEIILGLSRQESEFNPRAYSSAGARGVMQLIPSTAQLTARKEGLPYRRSALLDDPTYNMTIGSAHLSHLLDRFDGSMILTFAAYNAGPHRADRWIEDFGDPRSSEVDPLDWIEMIPFSETRNYVQRVLENTQVYRGRLDDAPIPGKLAADIERGGPSGRAAKQQIPSARLAALAQINADPGRLVALPAQTALLATKFREKRLAALTPAPPSPSLSQEETTLSPEPVKKPNRGNRNTNKPAAPVEEPNTNAAAPQPAPQTAPQSKAIEPVPATIEGGQAAPQTSTQEEISAPSKLDNLTAGSDAPPISSSIPASTASGQIVEDESASPAPVNAAVQEPRPLETDTANPEVAARAAKIVEKASARLNIEEQDQEDALAAAIARGLQQMEAENDPTSLAPDNQPTPDACAEQAEGDAAADLNARMMAQLRGEPDISCEQPAPVTE